MGLSIKIKIIFITLFLVLLSSVVVGFIIENLTNRTNADPGHADEFRRDTLFILGVYMFLVFTSAVLFSFKVMGPVDDLIIGTQLVAQGKLDHKIRKKSDDEIGRLVDSFNNMIVKLRVSQDRSFEYSNIATVEKQKAELIIDSMADGVIVTDSLHHVTLLNEAAQKLFGIDEKKVIGKHIVNLLKQFKLEKLFEEFPDIDETMLPVREPNVKIREVEQKSGKVLKATLAPLRNENNMVIGMIMVIEDITKLKELDKLKTEFVSTVSHELRTPLTSIKGYAALMSDEKLGPLNEKQKKSVSIINKESDRLTNLINDILDLSKLESGNAKTTFTLTDIRKCIDECQIFNVAKAKGIHVQKIIPKDLPDVLLDKAKIIQVFTNLISNAIKFTKPGGKILVKITNTLNHIRIDIKDTGIGIPKKDIPNLFNKFYQVESHLTRNQGGTGLGLPIVKEIIGLHYGLLSVKSKLHKGTTVSFALPKHPITKNELIKCWEKRGCKKVKCPAYQRGDKRCWLYIGSHCKKSSSEPCLDKIEICTYCDIYKNNFKDEKEDNSNSG